MENRSVISRKSAVDAGLSRYFTGKPCVRGHISERMVSNHVCETCSKEAWQRRNVVRREKYIPNPRPIPESKKARLAGLDRFFTGKKCTNGHVAERYASDGKCVECVSAMNKRKDKGAASNRARQWAADNRGRRLEIQQKWNAKNSGKVLELTRRRQASKVMATPKWYGEFDAFVIEAAYDLAKLREAVVGGKWHVDHHIPLTGDGVCGLHCAANVQVIPATINVKKHNRMIYTEPFQWLEAA